MRRVLTLVHRWTGLALAAFLIVVAGTGTLLPFMDDIQHVLAPDRYVAAPSAGARQLDWLTLHRLAERRSGGVASTLLLHRDGEAAPVYFVQAVPGRPPLGFDEIVLDPYTGREIARDTNGALRDGVPQLMPFLYLVHQQLALGDWGTWLLGITALAWTMDCFVGFYLTLPRSRWRWWRGWRKAWVVRFPVASRFRLHFDLHRSAGLWFWPMMLVFAWSGVAFNLPAIYAPVMRAVSNYVADPLDGVRQTPSPKKPDWAAGLMQARRAAATYVADHHLVIQRERELRYDPGRSVYSLAVRTDRDRSDDGANSWFYVNGANGKLIGVNLPTGDHAGNTADYWLGLLHEAAVLGLPFRILVSVSGFAIVLVTITGVLVYLRKHAAAKGRHRRHLKHVSTLEGESSTRRV